MLAHLDVVEAKREDWTRDPFTLVEEDGYFYARGAADDKAMAAIWVDTLVRYRQEGFQPRRTIKLALTCGEETNGAFNGAEYLAKNQRAPDRRGLCGQRGRRRPARRERQAGLPGHPGRREAVAELHAGGDQPRRPLLAAAAGQRHLSPGRRAGEHPGLPLSRSPLTTRRGIISQARER